MGFIYQHIKLYYNMNIIVFECYHKYNSLLLPKKKMT